MMPGVPYSELQTIECSVGLCQLDVFDFPSSGFPFFTDIAECELYVLAVPAAEVYISGVGEWLPSRIVGGVGDRHSSPVRGTYLTHTKRAVGFGECQIREFIEHMLEADLAARCTGQIYGRRYQVAVGSM